MRIRGGGAVAAGAVLCAGTALFGCGGGPANQEPRSTGSEPPPASEPAPGRSPSQALRGKVIVVDPGHNGGNADHPEEINKKVFIGNGVKPCNTTGTRTPQGYTEHAFTWDVANRLARVLRARGAEVTLTRANDTGVGPCITERAAVGNRVRADAVVSVHGDGAAPSGHGFHVITPKPVGKNVGIVAASQQLGTSLRDAYRAGTGLPPATYVGRDGLDRRDDLGGLNMSTVPVAFVECGNMQNPGDAARMSSAAFRQRMADALAAGVVNHLR